MNKEEILYNSEWFKTRPQIIKDAIVKLPPTKLYRLKETGKQCKLYSYTEPNDDNEEVTVTVILTGVGGPLDGTGFEKLDEGLRVFGYKLDDLEPWNQ